MSLAAQMAAPKGLALVGISSWTESGPHCPFVIEIALQPKWGLSAGLALLELGVRTGG